MQWSLIYSRESGNVWRIPVCCYIRCFSWGRAELINGLTVLKNISSNCQNNSTSLCGEVMEPDDLFPRPSMRISKLQEDLGKEKKLTASIKISFDTISKFIKKLRRKLS